MKKEDYTGLCAARQPISVTDADVRKALENEQRINSVIIQKDGRKIRVLQKLDDEFAKDFSEFDTLEEWEEEIREELYDQRYDESQEELERVLLEEIIERTGLVPDEEFTVFLYEELMEEQQERAASMHLDLEEYAQKTGRTAEELSGDLRKEAEFAAASQMVLHEIAAREGLSVTEEEVLEYLEGGETEEEIEAVRDELLMEAAMDYVLSHARIEEPEE